MSWQKAKGAFLINYLHKGLELCIENSQLSLMQYCYFKSYSKCACIFNYTSDACCFCLMSWYLLTFKAIVLLLCPFLSWNVGLRRFSSEFSNHEGNRVICMIY